MIVTVFNYGAKTSVPITPHTTVSDIIECCRDPGDEYCKLICPEIKGETRLNWNFWTAQYIRLTDSKKGVPSEESRNLFGILCGKQRENLQTTNAYAQSNLFSNAIL